jgi:hypothetical protein
MSSRTVRVAVLDRVAGSSVLLRASSGRRGWSGMAGGSTEGRVRQKRRGKRGKEERRGV